MLEGLPLSLAGRHALITGGGTGIGAAIARALAGAGAAVTLVGRRREPLEAVAAGLVRAAIAVADVTERLEVDAAMQAAVTAFGPPGILIANAGAAETAAFDAMSAESWRRMQAINLEAVFHCAQAATPHLKASDAGRLIVVASTAGLKGYGYTAGYVAAKHGAVGLVRALAAEWARTAVTVNAICPGFTDTGIINAAVDKIVATTGRTADAARGELTRHNPQGRLVDPAEVAAAALFLALPSSSAVTGQALVVAGGEL